MNGSLGNILIGVCFIVAVWVCMSYYHASLEASVVFTAIAMPGIGICLAAARRAGEKKRKK